MAPETRERIAAEVELWGGPLDGHRMYVHDVEKDIIFNGWHGATTNDLADEAKRRSEGAATRARIESWPIRYRARPDDLDNAKDLAAFGGKVIFDYTPEVPA